MNLDIKDKRILAELDLNARATFNDIGKVCQLSKESVIYRIKQLEKKGIIQRYTALVNFTKLGYTGFAVYNRLSGINEEKKQEILSYLQSIPEVYWIAIVGGKYDIIFGIMCKSVFQFNKIYYSILNKYGEYLVDNTISIRTELRQNMRNYLISQKNTKFQSPYFGKEPEQEKLDELDENILSILSNNARMSTVEIAKHLKKPASTIALRIKGLEKNRVIQGYSTYIKAQKFGMQSYRFLITLDNMDEQARNKLFSYSYHNPRMILAIETVGRWNFEITLEVENQEQLQLELHQLRESFKEQIRNIDILIMFEDDLVYDPYPIRKKDRKELMKN